MPCTGRNRGIGTCVCAGEERSVGPLKEGRSESGKQEWYFWQRTWKLLKLQRQKGLIKWCWTSWSCTWAQHFGFSKWMVPVLCLRTLQSPESQQPWKAPFTSLILPVCASSSWWSLEAQVILLKLLLGSCLHSYSTESPLRPTEYCL